VEEVITSICQTKPNVCSGISPLLIAEIFLDERDKYIKNPGWFI